MALKQLDHTMAMCDEQLLESLEDMILLERDGKLEQAFKPAAVIVKTRAECFYLQRVGSGQWLGCRMCRFGCIHAD